jgi:hypothetical protein
VTSWMERLRARPAYQRALASGDLRHPARVTEAIPDAYPLDIHALDEETGNCRGG